MLTISSRAKTTRATRAVALLIAILVASAPQMASAVTPQSPEVQAVIKKAMAYLDKSEEPRLGGKCLIAMAYLKTKPPQPKHPKVAEALAACRAGTKSRKPHDMYSNGLAIIFLCEYGGKKYGDLVNYYLGALKKRQKEHGGWGYDGKETGDTSQTQYAALSYWEAHNNGFGIDSQSVVGLTDWLLKTQDPSGAWGYQGKLPKEGRNVKQSEITCSMVAAAMGSTLISADLFGMLESGNDPEARQKPISSALRLANPEKKERKRADNLSSGNLDRKGLFTSLRRGDAWMDKNYKQDIGRYNVYYLYSLERYKSFDEKLKGNPQDEPQWYNNGFKYLKTTQSPEGAWSTGCGHGPDTAFGVLFLVRSTQQMIRARLSDVARGIAGLPKPRPGMKLVEGQFVVEQTEKALDDLMGMLDGVDESQIDQLASDPSSLILTGELDEAAEQRLRQVVRTGSPSARLLAVRTLGRTGKLDQAPILIFALTDPDRRVTLEARDALRFISRRFDGFGLKDNYDSGKDEAQARRAQNQVADKWKSWYRSVRPNAVVTIQ